MSWFSKLGSLVFKTKQGTELKIDKTGKLVDPETGASLPYDPEDVLDDASLAQYKELQSGKPGSVSNVLSLGTGKADNAVAGTEPLTELTPEETIPVGNMALTKSADASAQGLIGKNKDAYSPEAFQSLAPAMTDEAKAAHTWRGDMGYLDGPGGATSPNAVSLGLQLADIKAKLKTADRSALKAEVEKLYAQLEDLRDELQGRWGQDAQIAAMDSSKVTLDKPIYISRSGPEGQKPDSTYSALVIDPTNYARSASTLAELDDPGHNIYKLPQGTSILHPGSYADPNEVLVKGADLASAEQAPAGTLVRSYKKGEPLFSVTGIGLAGALATQSEDAQAMPAFAEQPQTEPKYNDIGRTALQQANGDIQQAYQLLVEEGATHQEISEALDLPFQKQLTMQQGYTPEEVDAYMKQNMDYAPRAQQLFAPGMPVETLTAAIEKVNQLPFNLSKSVSGWIGNEDHAREVAEYNQQLSGTIVAELQNRGYPARINQAGDVEVQDTKIGEWREASGDTLTSIMTSLTMSTGEIAGGIGGAMAGARAGAALPLPPQGRAVAAVGGAIVGGATGVFGGNIADQWVAATILKQKLDMEQAVTAAAAAGVEDIMLGSIIGGVLKGGKATYNATVNVVKKAKNAVDEVMLQGALKELENITGLTKADRQALAERLEEVSVERQARNEARREIEGVLQTRPGMEILVGEASRISKTAGFGLLKEMDSRAKSVIEAANGMTAGNISRVVNDELGGPKGYIATVKKGYEGIKQLGINEAEQVGFRYDPQKLIDLPKVVEDAEAGITDKATLDKLDRFVVRMRDIASESDKEFGFGELLEYRRALVDFKESGAYNHIANQRASRALSQIDAEIAKAVDMMPNGKAWSEQFAQAKVEYSKMKALQKNVMYKALTKPGASADDVVKSMAKFIKAEDGTFMSVVGKLPPKVRSNVEGAVIRNLTAKHTVGEAQGYQAIDYPALARELEGITFTTESARDLKRVVDKFAKVYLNDQELAAAAGAIQTPKNKTYLATSIAGRVNMALHNQLFNYVSRYLPTQQGRTRRLAEAVSDVLDNPLNAKSVEKLTRELPGDPELKTTLQQLAVKYAERGQRETYPKVPLYKVYKEGHSQSTSSTQYGDGIQYFTSKQAAESAKASGQVVEEVLVEPSRYVTLDHASQLLGKELTPELLKQTRVIEQLKDHGFLGIADKDLVFEFK